jgi:hypothetical protein
LGCFGAFDLEACDVSDPEACGKSAGRLAGALGIKLGLALAI